MSDPFIGEIRMFGGNFAPTGWAMCNGGILPIAQNTALFSLLGTMYGGDGASTFGLPNLMDRVPIHRGMGPELSIYEQGQSGGQHNTTLNNANLPAHSHSARGVNQGANQTTPGADTRFAAAPGARGKRGPSMYSSSTQSLTALSPACLTLVGSSQPVAITKPVLVVNFIIALQGIYPSRA